MEYATVRGIKVPKIGLGTARMTGEGCRQAVETGLDLGYRHLDTAQLYDNEDAVGEVIAASGVDRSEVFLTTKLHRRNLAPEDVFESFAASLNRLGTDYVDLLLIHAPSDAVPVEETIDAMNELQDEGKVERVGVSNFSVEQLRAAMDASDTLILTNQVEYHPHYRQDDLLEFCIDEDVALTAYSPLDEGRLTDDATLVGIGDRYGKTAGQVGLRWLVQQENVVAIPKASSLDHQRENLDVFDFELTDEEMERLFELRKGLAGPIRDLLGL
jgi:diketogulonate reductase-like aldo/keto reductase